jgi:hypothetical protein
VERLAIGTSYLVRVPGEIVCGRWLVGFSFHGAESKGISARWGEWNFHPLADE